MEFTAQRHQLPPFRRSTSRSSPSRAASHINYMTSLDGNFPDFDMKSISNGLTRFLYCVPKNPYNRAYVSAYLRIEIYYAQDHMINYYSTYRTDIRDIGMAPNAFLYQNADGYDRLRLFNYNSQDDVHNSHIRKDITNNNKHWYRICVEAAVIAFSGIAMLPFGGSQSYTHSYSVYQPEHVVHSH